MRPGPKKPGESAADYNTRVKAMEQKWMSGTGRPKGGGTQGASKPGAPSRPVGPVPPKPRGMTPIPPKPRTPVKPFVTTPRPIRTPKDPGTGAPKPRTGGGGVKGGGGTAPRPGYGGGKPKR